MNDNPVIVVGAGGHAAVIADTLLAQGRSVLGFVDPSIQAGSRLICGLQVLGDDDHLDNYSPAHVSLANGIGSISYPFLRKKVQEYLQALGWYFIGVVHPSAIVSPYAKVAPDVQILANTVVQANAIISEGCVINTGAIIEHDAILGSWVHAAPGSLVCGGAKLGDFCHVGASATVIQGIQLGAETLIGAGATVIRSFAGKGTLVGIPAKKLEE
ncbi:acetyltransferase [Parvibium lacunae]|uniref:Sugar acetyltransferase n=1 Tax=Parvibium lacunae TaxID=1888893 RepID=A0A368L1M6_9BURK|nr:acetyltransferase [Parvibium lacunae]RCS57432.1 sugar acetyltransferase [Parvibium lacunae]